MTKGGASREVGLRGDPRRCATPPPPAVQVVQPENFSFIKRKDCEARVSQNPAADADPVEQPAQGMYRDFGEPGPSSGAGSAYGGPAQHPAAAQAAAQQQVRAAGPLGVPGWMALGTLCSAPVRYPARVGNRSGDQVWRPGPMILSILRCPGADYSPRPRDTRDAVGTKIPPSRLPPYSSLTIHLSLRLRYRLSFFLSAAKICVPPASP